MSWDLPGGGRFFGVAALGRLVGAWRAGTGPEDPIGDDLGDEALGSDVVPGTCLKPSLDVDLLALRESGRKLRGLAEDDDPMPVGVALALALGVVPDAIGGDGETTCKTCEIPFD